MHRAPEPDKLPSFEVDFDSKTATLFSSLSTGAIFKYLCVHLSRFLDFKWRNCSSTYLPISFSFFVNFRNPSVPEQGVSPSVGTRGVGEGLPPLASEWKDTQLTRSETGTGEADIGCHGHGRQSPLQSLSTVRSSLKAQTKLPPRTGGKTALQSNLTDALGRRGPGLLGGERTWGSERPAIGG